MAYPAGMHGRSHLAWGLSLFLFLTGCQPEPTATAPAAATSNPSPEDAGQAVYVGSDLIRGYRPQSTVVTPTTQVTRARFPVIDFHCHWNARVPVEELLGSMDEMNIRYAVNLSGGFGSDLEQMIDQYVGPSNRRLIVFANVDFSRIDEPDFGAHAAAELESAYLRGARGLKIFKNLGLTLRDQNGALIAIDDPRIDPVWEMCARLRMPVLIHSADPIAFFQPIDANNERWMQLRRHPNWSFHGPQFPSWEEVIAQRNRLIARHRQTTFVVAHMGEASNNYALLGRWLDEHPNMYVDLSGRMNEIGRQPRASRAFFIRYADRILFGSDRYPGRGDQPRYPTYFRILQTADEYFDYYDHAFPPAGEWKVYALDLPDEVLAKVYGENAARLLGLDLKGSR